MINELSCVICTIYFSEKYYINVIMHIFHNNKILF